MGVYAYIDTPTSTNDKLGYIERTGMILRFMPCRFDQCTSSLFSVVNADGDDGVGDERAVAAVLVEQFQTAHHHRHVGAAVGERSNHLIDLHLVRAWRSDGHVDNHLIRGGAHQPGEPETAVVHGVKDGALGRQRIIQAVDIHAYPHFRHAAH